MTAAWDPKRYQGGHSYVWQFGESLLKLLEPRAGERILDVGCGTGQLTAEIARSGAEVVGLDSSAEMLDQARHNYPALTFVRGDATTFRFHQPFDAVFSNAALHWVKDQAAAARSIAAALRPGGRLVAEFGGKGNIVSVMSALSEVLGPEAESRCPWRFSSTAEFSAILEEAGLEVHQASLFYRPTPVESESGMEDWLRMFCGSYFSDVSTEGAAEKISAVAARLRAASYREGVWTIDYRRLRVVAVNSPNRSF